MIFKPSKHDRSVFGKLANEYGLTYFGTIVPTEVDDYTPVRGITASPEQIDDNYTSGNINGYNVRLLQRNHDLYLPDNRKVNRTWTICQTLLNAVTTPHIIICAKNKPSGNDQALTAYLRMYEISYNSLNCPIADDFANKFAIYVSPQNIDDVRRIITPELQAMLSVNFSDMDFELIDNELFIYSAKQPLTLNDLDKLLRLGVWLARVIENSLSSD